MTWFSLARTRRWLPLAGLAAIYAVVILVGNPKAWSGSDAGGKVATVKAMAEGDSWAPDVGYWAAAADPDGRFHPLVKTVRHDDEWVQVTSLPLVFAAVPLWDLGGAPAILVLPALGGLLAAVAARRLAINLGAEHGWTAFWLVGAGSPVLFYAGDFWEHAPALGLILLAVAELTRPEVTARHALLGGIAAGAAAALRAELALYLLAFAAGVVMLPDIRRFWLARVRLAGLAAAAAAGVVALNALLERAVVGVAIQGDRVGDQASVAGDELSQRLRDDALTTFGLFPETTATAYLLGVGAVVGLVLLGLALRHRGDRHEPLLTRWGAGITFAAYFARIAREGLGFVPGTLPAAPSAAGAPALIAGPAHRLVLVTAVVGVPAVWYFQWQGDLIAQWGGRYTLATGVLLTVITAAAIEKAGLRTVAAAVLVGATAVVSLLGAAWHADRTRDMATAVERIDEAPDDVVIVSTLPHLGREAGAFYGDHRWLRLDRVADAGDLETLLADLEVDRIDLVEPIVDGWPHPDLADFEPGGERTVPYLLDLELRITRYERR